MPSLHLLSPPSPVCRSSRRSNVRMAFDEMIISSRVCPDGTSPSARAVDVCRPVDDAFCDSSVMARRRRLPNALYPPQLTGWHLPKQTRMLHWNRMLSLDGNLKALKDASRLLVSALYCHSPKMLGSVAHPFSSVTMYSFSTLSSIVFAMQVRANPP